MFSLSTIKEGNVVLELLYSLAVQHWQVHSGVSEKLVVIGSRLIIMPFVRGSCICHREDGGRRRKTRMAMVCLCTHAAASWTELII